MSKTTTKTEPVGRVLTDFENETLETLLILKQKELESIGIYTPNEDVQKKAKLLEDMCRKLRTGLYILTYCN